MRLLLDTHLLLWALAEPARLDAATRTALEDPGNEVLFSAASLWEIAIKAGLGRPDFAVDPDQVLAAALETGFLELPVRAAAAIGVARLPPLHRDPFDRLLVAQAMAEPARLYTADPLLPPYSELVTLVGRAAVT
ncbi:twitching motility protein PilT [Pseudoroseomonas deserti]|uniref:Twitching motility protein PilT n=1 Tax=Teichococcus deserti TaxID=1817963 RepID=A0A1V2H341_9PROT|nr:type II toxin-antitoxin system VapC family toxin [Pseudoroseomonas deserti]ONG52585.1 twitching motility protein PilT [Pseudoroseomonas deserti]